MDVERKQVEFGANDVVAGHLLELGACCLQSPCNLFDPHRLEQGAVFFIDYCDGFVVRERVQIYAVMDFGYIGWQVASRVVEQLIFTAPIAIRVISSAHLEEVVIG